MQNLKTLKEIKDHEQKNSKFLVYRIFRFLFQLDVKTVWNKEQNVSRWIYLISRYGKHVSNLFFGSFEMSLSKGISGTCCLFQELCYFFSGFPFSLLSIQTATGFALLIFPYTFSKGIFCSCLVWLRIFLLFSSFSKNPGQFAGIYSGCRKHGNIKCQASICISKLFSGFKLFPYSEATIFLSHLKLHFVY